MNGARRLAARAGFREGRFAHVSGINGILSGTVAAARLCG